MKRTGASVIQEGNLILKDVPEAEVRVKCEIISRAVLKIVYYPFAGRHTRGRRVREEKTIDTIDRYEGP